MLLIGWLIVAFCLVGAHAVDQSIDELHKVSSDELHKVSSDESINQSINQSLAPVPSVNAPSSTDQWLIRGQSTYQLINANQSIIQQWDIQSINDKLKNNQPIDQYNYQQDAIDRLTSRLANQFKYNNQPTDQPIDRSTKQSIPLIDWYLKHVQCRSCVAMNHQLIDPSINPYIDESIDQPIYIPNRIMKWCSKTYTRRQLIDQSTNQPIDQPIDEPMSRPLMDYEGYCIQSINQCPQDSIDLNIIDQSTCHNDDASIKRSCAECVTDDHVWRTSLIDQLIDGYAGECWARAVLAFTDFRNDPNQVFVDRLDQCAQGAVWSTDK